MMKRIRVGLFCSLLSCFPPITSRAYAFDHDPVSGPTASATASATTNTSESGSLPAELLDVQRNLWLAAFRSFVMDLRAANPTLDLGAGPMEVPPFDGKLTRNEWIRAFTDQLAKERNYSTEATRALEERAERMFTSYYHDQGFARVPFLQVFDKDVAPSAIRRVEKTAVPKTYPGDHTLDIPAYVAERFPRALQDFVVASHVDLNLDDSSCEDALSYQKTQGFTQATRFMGARDNWESQFIFVFNPGKKKYRLSICDIHGEDDKTRILAILGPVFKDQKIEFVRHRKPAPIFRFNDEGHRFDFGKTTARIIIGFQNTVWWQLKTSAPGWERRALTEGGTEIAVFENKQTSEIVLSMANVYGDEMLQALESLYAKGARRFVYLGTCGALDPEFQLGDLLIPNRFLRPTGAGPSGKWIEFSNDAEKIKVDLPAPARRISATAQGWVGTLIEETKDHLRFLQKAGAGAIDVESRYFAEFMMHHPVKEKAAIIVVSDQPLGSKNYNGENATRDIPMKSINALLPRIMRQSDTEKK